jgi:hypothetical protein
LREISLSSNGFGNDPRQALGLEAAYALDICQGRE